jgi:hypothetical protein
MVETLVSVWQNAVGKDVGLLGVFTSDNQAQQFIAANPNAVLVQGTQDITDVTKALSTGDKVYAVYAAIDPIAFDVQFQLAEVTESKSAAQALQDELFQKLQDQYGKQDPIFKDEWTIVQELSVNEPLNPLT